METLTPPPQPTKMKFAVAIYHKNIKAYNPEWIKACFDSLQKQTFKDFDVYELDYGPGEGTRSYPGSIFEARELETHADAHNFLLDKVFAAGYDYAFNVNIDDVYALDRFEKQVAYAKLGYDVISSDFDNIDSAGKIIASNRMADLDIIAEANKDINIIAHPVLCYSKNFWTTCTRLWSGQIPKDDFCLWRRSYHKYKFIIIPELLLQYRVHDAKVSAPVTKPAYVERNPAAIVVGDIKDHPLYDPKADRLMKSSWDGVVAKPNMNQATGINAKPMTAEEIEKHEAARLERLKYDR